MYEVYLKTNMFMWLQRLSMLFEIVIVTELDQEIANAIIRALDPVGYLVSQVVNRISSITKDRMKN